MEALVLKKPPLLAWSIKFPDTIPVEVQILTENPAIRLVAKVEGQLEALLVENQQYVEKGTIVALIESPIKRHSITVLEKWLSRLEDIYHPKEYLKVDFFPVLFLGSLEAQYAALVQKVQDYQHYLRQVSTFSKIWTLEEQITHFQKINLTLKKQQFTLNKGIFANCYQKVK